LIDFDVYEMLEYVNAMYFESEKMNKKLYEENNFLKMQIGVNNMNYNLKQ